MGPGWTGSAADQQRAFQTKWMGESRIYRGQDPGSPFYTAATVRQYLGGSGLMGWHHSSLCFPGNATGVTTELIFPGGGGEGGTAERGVSDWGRGLHLQSPLTSPAGANTAGLSAPGPIIWEPCCVGATWAQAQGQGLLVTVQRRPRRACGRLSTARIFLLTVCCCAVVHICIHYSLKHSCKKISVLHRVYKSANAIKCHMPESMGRSIWILWNLTHVMVFGTDCLCQLKTACTMYALKKLNVDLSVKALDWSFFWSNAYWSPPLQRSQDLYHMSTLHNIFIAWCVYITLLCLHIHNCHNCTRIYGLIDCLIVLYFKHLHFVLVFNLCLPVVGKQYRETFSMCSVTDYLLCILQ